MAVLHFNFHSHPKMVGLSNASIGIYARMLSYASANLTDGYVPNATVRQICDKRRAFTSLVDAGLLDETTCWQMPGKCRANAGQKPQEPCGKCHVGYAIHDYLDYNPSKVQVEEKRKAIRERAKRARGSKSQEGSAQQNRNVFENVHDIGKDNPLTSKATATSTAVTSTEDGDEVAAKRDENEAAAKFAGMKTIGGGLEAFLEHFHEEAASG